MHKPNFIKLSHFRATYFYPLALLILTTLCFLFVDYPFLEHYAPYAKTYRRFFQVISMLIFPPFHLIFWSLAFLWARFISSKKELCLPLFEIVIAQCLSIAFVRTSKLFFGRARPDSLLRKDLPLFDFLSSSHHFHSFPSGHTMTIFALAASLAYVYPKKRVYLIFGAFLLASSRIMLLNHFPSDLFATALVGILIAQGVHRALQSITNGSPNHEKRLTSRSS